MNKKIAYFFKNSKRKIVYFFKNLKKWGLHYALATSFMFTFEDSKYEFLRDFSDRCYDYAYDLDEKARWNDYVEECREEEYEEPVVTPCGCRIVNDCRECGSYPICCR